MSNNNWLNEMFINEAKAALKAHSTTHWVSEELDLIYENKSLDFTQNFVFDIEEDLSILFEIGKTYVVNWNGVNYECVVHDEDNATCLGNDGLRDLMNGVPKNGENVPFYFVCFREYPVVQVFTPVDITTNYPVFVGMCEVAIYKKVEKIHRIDPKFLPEGYPYTIYPVTVAELNPYGDNYKDVPVEGQVLYHLSTKVFTMLEELYGLYIMGVNNPIYYIDADNKCKYYSMDYETMTLSHIDTSYYISNMFDDAGEIVGFELVLDRGAQYEDRFCCIYKDCTIRGISILAGTYLDFKSGVAPMPMVALTTGYEEKVVRLPEKYMPLLTSEDGTKYKLAVGSDGMLYTKKVNE